MLNVWMARDNTGRLNMFFKNKPVRETWGGWEKMSGEIISLDDNHVFGIDLTWEDEPREIELVERHQDVFQENGQFCDATLADYRNGSCGHLRIGDMSCSASNKFCRFYMHQK